MHLTPYILFNGNCEEALNFYATALQGEIKTLSRYEGTPAGSMSADKQKIMHSYFVAGGIAFMAADADDGAVNSGMVHLCIDFRSSEEEQKVFEALSEGGKVTLPLEDTFWGARFSMLTDRFGIKWMLNYEKNKA